MRRHAMVMGVVGVLVGAVPAAVAAQAPCLTARDVTFTPSPPRAGTLFRVHLPPALAASVTTARLAGEPLHFRTLGDSVSAFAAVPVDSTRGLTLALLCTNGARVTVRMDTRDGEYPLERLTVAPRFSAPPDSALQARQRREAARASAVSRASHATPRLFSEPFLVPRTTRITSGFGGGRTFNGTVTSRHMGTDYAGPVGAPIRAANRGVVRLVDGFYLGGNVIYLDHGDGLVTAYLHLSRHRVAEGDTVARGQVIGDVGATGRVTGPHLHFIVRYGNVTVDPESVVERK